VTAVARPGDNTGDTGTKCHFWVDAQLPLTLDTNGSQYLELRVAPCSSPARPTCVRRHSGCWHPVAIADWPWEDDAMSGTPLTELLRLPPGARAELAMALWESLSHAEREAALPLDAELLAELDRRWDDHVADPGSAIPWEEVRRKLRS